MYIRVIEALILFVALMLLTLLFGYLSFPVVRAVDKAASLLSLAALLLGVAAAVTARHRYAVTTFGKVAAWFGIVATGAMALILCVPDTPLNSELILWNENGVRFASMGMLVALVTVFIAGILDPLCFARKR